MRMRIFIAILSEPNIYDTYYWILWNDGDASEECQEIMIPAGTVYQTDGATFVGAFISVEFNVSDALIGHVALCI